MLFVITCTDKSDSLDLRMATRPAHLAYLTSAGAKLTLGGPLLADGRPTGSMTIFEADDITAAQDFAANDPYALAGLFAEVRIQPFRAVFKDGAQVA